VIQNSQHFIYIENQFFITATNDEQYPVQNKIGQAIVERIIRAYKAGEKYKVIVLIPSVPGFAGDLHDKSNLGTLAIMNLQYRSICRGELSIIGQIQAAGIDATKYIRFYNLRNYDRINNSATMAQAEQQSGVSYETARKEHDDMVGAGYGGYGERTGAAQSHRGLEYDRYQKAASNVQQPPRSEDTVSDSYMLGGRPLTSTTWAPGNIDEIDCFVSEELYLHTKCLIADDKVVIVGSANLNDRSQLGNHDSEIAVVIEDPVTIDSRMDGQPYLASKFAVSLRRQLFRKHLGLIPPQDHNRPDANFTPSTEDPNAYDWGSKWDLMVQDPLSLEFENLWNSTAATNTSIFERVFRPVPSDSVRTWEGYQNWYGQYFVSPNPPGTKNPEPAPYRYGHVFKKNFPGGVQEVKEALGGVKGMLVEMPLGFLSEVKDLVSEGLGYNVLTEEIYT
jgi:phospholipase D1/2